MPLRGKLRPISALAVALAVGLVVRLARITLDPLMHPDGPAYLDLAGALLRGKFLATLGGYYSPLYPAAVAGLAATGLPVELAGRTAAVLAGLAALPLLHVLVRRHWSEQAADVAVLVAAVHPALVQASAQVLPETLTGALLLAWLVARPAALAGVFAGATYLARPEGVLLLPLGLWQRRRQQLVQLAGYAAAAVLVMAPALLALRAASGHWQLSPREARIAGLSGVPGATTLVAAALHAPRALLGRMAVGVVRQTLFDVKALGLFCLVPFAVGLWTATAGRWPLAIAAGFTALPLALNPSPRYAVPLVPLFLPWTGAGLVALGARLGRWARPAAAVLGLTLCAQALWVSHPFDLACSREVSQLVLERYGTGQTLVAIDGRFAYGAHGHALVPATTDPEAALALAREKGARLWLTRPAWIPRPWTPPADARAVARPCGGTFVLFELGG
jgi:hypothetical protein